MIRNLKALGLALVAMFAFSAMAASSASAVDVFTSDNEVETVTGTGTNHKFTITSPHLKVECATAGFHGSVENGGTRATIFPHYTGTPGKTHEGHCGSDLGTVDVSMNTCDYTLTGETTGEDAQEPGSEHGTVWIECENEDEIEIEASELGVTLYVPEQTPTEGGVTYTNNEGHVDVKATVTGITYTCEPAFLCGLGGLKTENNNAHYTGDTTIHGARGPISWSQG